MKSRLIVIGLTVSLIIAITFSVRFIDRKQEVEVVHSETSPQTNTPFENLDHLIRESVVIVSGIIRDVSDFDSSTKEYLFTIDEELKGDSGVDQIYIYENTPIFDIGQKYVLFLSKWEGGLYPQPVHTTIDPANIIAIHDNKVAHNYSFLGDEIRMEQFFHAIRISRFIQTEPSYIAEHGGERRIPLELDTTEEIFESSDVVAHVRPNYVSRENKYFKTISADVLELFKGDRSVTKRLKDEAIIYVPAGIRLNREYLIFLVEHDGVYQVTTRSGSVLSSNDVEQWNDMLNEIETY